MPNQPLRSQEEANAFLLTSVEVDVKIYPLVVRLNTYNGITTLGSCGGHQDPIDAIGQSPENEWYVTFAVSENSAGLASLKRIAGLLIFFDGVTLDLGVSNIYDDGYGLMHTLNGVDTDPQEVVEKLNEFKSLTLNQIIGTILETTFEV